MFLSFRISLEAQLARVFVRLFFDFLPLAIKFVIASLSITGTSWLPKHETKSLFNATKKIQIIMKYVNFVENICSLITQQDHMMLTKLRH